MASAETITDNSLAISNLQPMPAGEIQTGNSKPWQFQPGQSGNPDGRPVIKHITDALKEQIAAVDPSNTSGAQRLAKKLMSHAENERDGYLSLAAIKEISDRTEGKAVQNTNVRGIIVMMPADAVIDAAFNGCEE